MRNFLKSLYWFLDHAFYFYLIHPKQFYKVGGKWKRRNTGDHFLITNYFAISDLSLGYSTQEHEQLMEEFVAQKRYELEEDMHMMTPFISRWIVDGKLMHLAKTGDNESYQLQSIGIVRKWK